MRFRQSLSVALDAPACGLNDSNDHTLAPIQVAAPVLGSASENDRPVLPNTDNVNATPRPSELPHLNRVAQSKVHLESNLIGMAKRGYQNGIRF
jgi:hypothetical protein